MTPDDPLDRAERFAARFRERGAVIPAPLRRAIRVLSAVPPHVRPRLSGALCVIHRELEPVFYVPAPERRLVQAEDLIEYLQCLIPAPAGG